MSSEDMNESDKVTGYIYVLKSLSTKPYIAQMKDLYKIGFTVNSVEERIANAEHEPTYLMASVKVIAAYKVANMNSHVLEQLIQMLDW